MAQFKEIDDIYFPFEVGALPTQEQAFKFADFLNAKGIKATAKPGFGASYSIYVANEKDVSQAKMELLRFGNNPFAKQYNQASWQQSRSFKKASSINSNFLSFSMGHYRWQILSLASIIEVICLLVYLLGLIPNMESFFRFAFSWISLSQITMHFELHRIITPIFLHFGIVHIAFNLVMFEAFARPIERRLGIFKLLYIILSVAIVSNLLELMFLPYNAIFGGLSGVVYGLIGYMAIISRRNDLPSDLILPKGMLLVSVIFIGFGFLLSNMANLCHLGGLLVGVLLGLADLKKDSSYFNR